ncbi:MULTISPECIES: ABC transporter ATP-binding protein [unclassified Burkholderia]|uniref:dipeptide ABC transporter ATP-binding protein n=1 Tax=unclassified Burkholderia TaxID=2613784 RepID=UPI000F58FDE2|nr:MULTISPECIES: ABC transporter ATP-binding protein [unclassified Burkholderia]RQS22944.1 ABC transporter ATP-binding protein [Burkholderia sp. Bp8995]RQS38157.1 ABC transporter ATP-binding protein [Burkholderia sp. Bp8989]RQZ31826.1 ABC transporter ATP-binding protein [Burkholderia sp. Bp9090]
MSGAPLLSVERLTLALPARAERRDAVRDVSLTVAPGEVLCVVGASGSGKSLLAAAIAGLLPRGVRHAAGRIALRGRDLTHCSDAQWRAVRGRDVSMIFQEPLAALNPLMTIGAQVDEVLRVHRVLSGRGDGAARAARVTALLRDVGLPEPERLRHAYPDALSGGQRQRVLIAMALALEPALLIADEPTTALDVTTQARILALIEQAARTKRTGVLLITHDFGVVARVADRVVVLRDGEQVESGRAADVLRAPRHPYTRALLDAVPHGRVATRAVVRGGVPLLDVQGLRKHYASRRALPFLPARGRRRVDALVDVGFALHAGETLGIVGESGSGKSTLARALVRLARVDAGRIVLRGEHDLARLADHALRPLRRDVQMVFQDPYASLNTRQTIAQIVATGLLAHGVGRAAAYRRAAELLAQVGLPPDALDRYPHEFSGGQRQRISLARALALDPSILVADEMVSGLDVSVQAQVLELLASVQKRRAMAIVFVTHDLRVAAQICDRIAVMQAGRIVELGDTAQVFGAARHSYTRALLDAMPVLPARVSATGTQDGSAHAHRTNEEHS